MNQNLVDLFQKKRKQSTGGAAIDWDDRRDKYLSAIKELYGRIEQMLSEPIAEKTVTVQRRAKQLSESYIGTYSADDLLLSIGDEQVRFSPRGRNISGAAGRVDVIGEAGEATLIVQADGRWGFVQTRQPHPSCCATRRIGSC